MSWQRENIPGLSLDRAWKYLLIPGFVLQWIMYMFPASGRASALSSTRHARSPLMTYVYSIAFWLFLIAYFGSMLISAS